jgi:hypothetical protein
VLTRRKLADYYREIIFVLVLGSDVSFSSKVSVTKVAHTWQNIPHVVQLRVNGCCDDFDLGKGICYIVNTFNLNLNT